MIWQLPSSYTLWGVRAVIAVQLWISYRSKEVYVFWMTQRYFPCLLGHVSRQNQPSTLSKQLVQLVYIHGRTSASIIRTLYYVHIISSKSILHTSIGTHIQLSCRGTKCLPPQYYLRAESNPSLCASIKVWVGVHRAGPTSLEGLPNHTQPAPSNYTFTEKSIKTPTHTLKL